MIQLDDLLNSHKILFHFAPILNQYLAGKREFNPIAIEIHPTNKCNHRCIHCSYKERNEKRLELPQDIMEKLISSVISMGVKAVYFSGGGEPTVYPNLSKHIERLHQNGVEVSLITNGTYLDEAGITNIANMFNYIAVSVPSVNEESFNNITKSNNLQKVLNVADAIKTKHAENSPIVGARVVVTNLIYKEVLKILEVLMERRYDYALFKLVRDYEDRGLGIGKKEEEYLKDILSSSHFDDNFTNINNIFEFKKTQFNGEACVVNELGMIANVDADGKVYPNIVEIGKSEFCIGDLNLKSLDNIWNSTEHLRVKESSNSKWRNKECKNCRAIAYNNMIDQLLCGLPHSYDPFI